MENNNSLDDIIKQLNDQRSKLSALYSLYNSSILTAEENRQTLSEMFDQLIDMKNDANLISSEIANTKRDERSQIITKNKSKITKLNKDVVALEKDFKDLCKKYRHALQDCGSLKAEYKHDISELCKQFKAEVETIHNVDAVVIKGYKQQVKIIKAILDKIELIISDYNVKKNKVDSDSDKFDQLYESVSSLLTRLEQTA